ncbi:MAG: histidine kinase [Eubacteriales bacterium]|nr:histidine kinase [Eubacteriales bacterium]
MSNGKSMRKTFWRLCVLIIVLVVLTFAFNVVFMRNVFVNNTVDFLRMTHRQTCINIEDYLKGVEEIAFSMCYSPSMQAFLKEKDPASRIALFQDVQSVYSNIVYINNAVMGFSVYDESGHFITANGTGFQAIMQGDSIELPSNIRYHTVYPPNPYIGHTLSCYTLTIPIIETGTGGLSHNVMGTVIFAVNLSYVQSQVKAGNIYQGSRMTLYGESGRILAASSEQTLPLQNNTITSESMINSTGWELVTSFEAGALADDILTVWWVTIATGILIIIIILLFLLLISRRILSPIESISRFMRSVSKDPRNLIYQSPEDSYEELSTMVVSMNLMLQSLVAKSEAFVEQEKNYYQAVLETNRLEILAYRSQINPHFLYNTLDCISGMAFRYNAPEIAQISQALSGMFRYAIRGKDFVTVEEELMHMQEYSTIIGHRFMGRITIQINATQEARTLRIPRLILQPIVENAVFHGLEKQIGPGGIQVDVYAQDGFLHMRVTDNGLGMSQESVDSIANIMANTDQYSHDGEADKGGIGLWNIAHRLRIFYNEKSVLRVESREGEGTTVEIILPLEQKEG